MDTEMNERIRELITEAVNFRLDSDSDAYEAQICPEDLEYLAKLIVQECAGLFPNVYVEIKNEYGHTPVIAADYIKKHFGVEE